MTDNYITEDWGWASITTKSIRSCAENKMSEQSMISFEGSERGNFMPFEKLTKVEGPVERRLEALWAEIKSLKERVEKLEKERNT